MHSFILKCFTFCNELKNAAEHFLNTDQCVPVFIIYHSVLNTRTAQVFLPCYIYSVYKHHLALAGLQSKETSATLEAFRILLSYWTCLQCCISLLHASFFPFRGVRSSLLILPFTHRHEHFILKLIFHLYNEVPPDDQYAGKVVLKRNDQAPAGWTVINKKTWFFYMFIFQLFRTLLKHWNTNELILNEACKHIFHQSVLHSFIFNTGLFSSAHRFDEYWEDWCSVGMSNTANWKF